MIFRISLKIINESEIFEMTWKLKKNIQLSDYPVNHKKLWKRKNKFKQT